MIHALLSRLSSARAHLSAFPANAEANVAPIFAIAIIPVAGLMGAAVDYSRANSIKAAMQAAADATALDLVHNAFSRPTGNVSETAVKVFNASFSRPEVAQVSAQSASNGVVTINATTQMATEFMGIMGVSTMTIGSRAVAMKVPGDGLGCVLALNRMKSGAVTAQGGTVANMIGCSIYDNSRNSTAMTVAGSARVSARSVSVSGGMSGNTGVTTTHGIRTNQEPIPDPYEKLQIPSYSGCDHNNFQSKKKITIDPGVYCGGMQFNAQDDVTFNPGVYIIDRGDFNVNGGAILKGTGVTIIFTSSTGSNWPTVTINGGATIDLRPSSTGTYAGVLMFGDRNIPVGTSFKFNGGATQYLGGAVYFPTGEIDFAGGAGTSTNCTQLIGDTINFTGNSGVAIDCAGYGVKPFSATNVRLVS